MENPNGPSPEAIAKAIDAIMPGLIRIVKSKQEKHNKQK